MTDLDGQEREALKAAWRARCEARGETTIAHLTSKQFEDGYLAALADRKELTELWLLKTTKIAGTVRMAKQIVEDAIEQYAASEEPLPGITEAMIEAGVAALRAEGCWSSVDEREVVTRIIRAALAAREEAAGEIDDREWTAVGEQAGAARAGETMWSGPHLKPGERVTVVPKSRIAALEYERDAWARDCLRLRDSVNSAAREDTERPDEREALEVIEGLFRAGLWHAKMSMFEQERLIERTERVLQRHGRKLPTGAMRDIERPATRTSDDDLADLQACAQEVRDAFAGEDTDQDNQGLREAANGVLDHYYHRRAKSLLQDRTLEAAMQRLHRAVAASSRDMSPVVRDTEQEQEG